MRREVGKLPAAAKQIVSMGRALSREARLLIMDEPSAVLAHDEVANLFRVIRDLTAQGIAVIYISHRLDEIRDIGDRVTVLKDGRTTAANLDAKTTPTRGTGEPDDRPEHRVRVPAAARGARPVPDGAPLLRVDGLTRDGEFADVSLTVHSGEIVGITGLVGSGRSELLETIFGARRAHAGTDHGRRHGRCGPAACRAAVRRRPRHGAGGAQEPGAGARRAGLPQRHARQLRPLRAGRLHRRRRRSGSAADEVAEQLDLRPRDVRRVVRTLSGGNQQKVVVGRWLLGGTRLLLLDEPTRGVDVGARAELYQVIRRLADSGVGVLHGLQRGAGGARPRRPGGRDARGPRRAAGAGGRPRRRHRSRPRHGGVVAGREPRR